MRFEIVKRHRTLHALNVRVRTILEIGGIYLVGIYFVTNDRHTCTFKKQKSILLPQSKSYEVQFAVTQIAFVNKQLIIF